MGRITYKIKNSKYNDPDSEDYNVNEELPFYINPHNDIIKSQENYKYENIKQNICHLSTNLQELINNKYEESDEEIAYKDSAKQQWYYDENKEDECLQKIKRRHIEINRIKQEEILEAILVYSFIVKDMSDYYCYVDIDFS
jgi:hypothetical protein